MTDEIIPAVEQLLALRPEAAELVARFDAGDPIDATEILSIYDRERAAEQVFTAAVLDGGHEELEDACALVASVLSGVLDVQWRWDESSA